MDIVHDGFGLMLALGDLAWVPFMYSLQARFVLEHPQDWSLIFLVGVLALNCEYWHFFQFHLLNFVQQMYLNNTNICWQALKVILECCHWVHYWFWTHEINWHIPFSHLHLDAADCSWRMVMSFSVIDLWSAQGQKCVDSYSALCSHVWDSIEW